MNAEPIEVVHLALATAGFAFSLWNVYDARADLRAVHRLKINSAAETTARGAFRNELLRSLQLACLIGVGLIAFVLPPPEHSRTAPRAFALGLFIVFDLLITANTYLTLRVRRRIYQQLGVKNHRERRKHDETE